MSLIFIIASLMRVDDNARLIDFGYTAPTLHS